MRSAITVSLVPETRGGPFVLWDELPAACHTAAQLGFDAVEIFAPAPAAVDQTALLPLLSELRLQVAAVGTGAGMVIHGLRLTDADSQRRAAAGDFVRQMIDFGGAFGAPAIIGSMQGRWGGDVSRETALDWLRGALDELGPYAAQYEVPLIYEPLNRYETNLVNTLAEGAEFIDSLTTDNVKLLADLFHMNIEEVDLAAAIRSAGRHIGHLHFVDSNRRPAGLGHLDFAPVADALRSIQYTGFVSAEAFPFPDPESAARQTIESYRRYFT